MRLATPTWTRLSKGASRIVTGHRAGFVRFLKKQIARMNRARKGGDDE